MGEAHVTFVSMRPDGSPDCDASNTKGMPSSAGTKGVLPDGHPCGAMVSGPVIDATGVSHSAHIVTVTFPAKSAPPAAALSAVGEATVNVSPTATVAPAVSRSIVSCVLDAVHVARHPSFAAVPLVKIEAHGALREVAGTESVKLMRLPLLESWPDPRSSGCSGMQAALQLERTRLCEVALQAYVKQAEDGRHTKPCSQDEALMHDVEVDCSRLSAEVTDVMLQ